MHTDPETVAEQFRAAATQVDPQRGYRLALGVWAVFVLGMALNWPFAFVGAVLTTLFLQAPAPPSLRAGTGLVAATIVLLFFGFAVFSALTPYPGVFLIAVVLLVGWAFAQSVAGKSPLLVVVALMTALMIPYLVTISDALAAIFALWLPLNLVIALLASWTAFALFPPDPAAAREVARTEAVAKFDPERRFLRMMLVTLPFVAVFTLIDSGAVLTLLIVAILSQQLAASTGAGPTVAKGMLLANLAGGAAAVICYELVVIDTRFGFMMLVTLLLCLVMARWLVSERPTAAQAGSALTTALILFGGAMAPFGGDVDGKMLTRLAQVGAALLWVLAAFVIVDRFLPERVERPSLPSWKRKRTGRPGRARTPRHGAPRA